MGATFRTLGLRAHPSLPVTLRESEMDDGFLRQNVLEALEGAQRLIVDAVISKEESRQDKICWISCFHRVF